MENKLLLTHTYDNQLTKDIYDNIEPFVFIFNSMEKSDKLVMLDKLRSVINIDNTSGIEYYDKMVKDFIDNTDSNYDPINKLNAIDLLYIIFTIYQHNYDIIPLFIEQLKDLESGFCPQGRTIRLIQIIQPYFSLIPTINKNNISERSQK